MTNSINKTIDIDTIVFGGFGLGRLDGKVILVEHAVPGDRVRINIYEEHPNYSIAEIVEIIKPSHLRIKPECPVAGVCGGCSFQNINYEHELQYKKEMIIEQLRRVAGLNDIEIPVIETITDNRFMYRSHTRFNYSHGIRGFFKKRSNEIVPFPEQGCLLLSEDLNKGIRNSEFNNNAEIRASSDFENNIHLSENNQFIEIKEYEAGFFFYRDIRGFFQANRFLRGEMIKRVVEFSGIDRNNTFLDVCSGCGFFTLPIAKAAGRGYGFDIDPMSINYAKKNSKINKINNVEFFNISESEIKPHLYNPVSIVIDPPRSGLTKRGRKTVNGINPERIVYVSCNPSTFARDLKDFIKNNYTLSKVIFIDMFPCTHHIEMISLITKSYMTIHNQVN